MKGLLVSLLIFSSASGCGPFVPPDPDCLARAPENIHLRDATQSFNREYQTWLCNGSIYIKPVIQEGRETGDWQRLRLPIGLADDVDSIAMDDRFLEAASSRREIWLTAKVTGDLQDLGWVRHQGMPIGLGVPNNLEQGYRAWTVSSATHEVDVSYTDSAGWRREVGWAGCTHLLVLKKHGQWIGFNDGWLPADWNYEMCTPLRGRFISENLSSSGSRHMVIGRFGDIFTRIYDYDVSGGNNPFADYFDYTYEDQRHLTDDTERVFQLPPWPWYRQPKIDGRITDRISLHKLGEHGLHAMMRVEGWDEEGRSGYYEKDAHDVVEDPGDRGWTFVVTNLPIKGTELENSRSDTSELDLGPAEDVCFAHNLEHRSELPGFTGTEIARQDWAAEILAFHPYCSPAVLRIHVSRGQYYDLALHSTETLRTEAIHEGNGRGLTQKERPRSGNIEVPENLFDRYRSDQLHPVMMEFIRHHLGGQRFHWVDISVSRSRLKLTKDDWFFGGIHWELEAVPCEITSQDENQGNINEPGLASGDSDGFEFEHLYLDPRAAKVYPHPETGAPLPSERNIFTFRDLSRKGW